MTVAEPATAPTDEVLFREAVEIANIPTLLMVLVQLTGDLTWLESRYHPSRGRGLEDNDTGGLPQPIQSEIRGAALAAIIAWRAGKPVALANPSNDMLARMMSISMGEPVPIEYAPMIAQELGVRNGEGPANDDADQAIAPPSGFSAVIIGAGISGLAAAINLDRLGVAYTIVERNDSLGGTWLENHYPGCGVDTPNHLYSYSFARHDWSHYFALRDELREYLESVATKFGVRPKIRFGVSALSATFDAGAQAWSVVVADRDGAATEVLQASIVISAVGAFNRPVVPDIAGLQTFQGRTVHTARWDDNLDLSGQRVAVIGNGASAMQLVPAIADEVASLTIFQRSPQWAAPFEKHKLPVSLPVRFLLNEVPLYQAWYRARLTWTFSDKTHSSLQIDPAWPHPDRAVNAANDGHRQFFTQYLRRELGDRQDLLPDVVPKYPPFGKRMLLDNGWYRTLTKDNVELVTEPIREIVADGVVTESGAKFGADVIALATGFDVVHFLSQIDVIGRSGRSLRETWDGDDARAYLGLTMPDFPNFFCLYGPNTQTGHGGSLILSVEMQLHYLSSLLRQMFAGEIGVIECKQAVHDEYNTRVDAAHESMVWTHRGMGVYYRNSRGRVVVNSPFRVIDFWHMTRNADLNDYLIEERRAVS